MMQNPKIKKITFAIDSTFCIGSVSLGVHFENWKDVYFRTDNDHDLHISLITFPVEEFTQ